jgi:hypothetical protein
MYVFSYQMEETKVPVFLDFQVESDTILQVYNERLILFIFEQIAMLCGYKSFKLTNQETFACMGLLYNFS